MGLIHCTEALSEMHEIVHSALIADQINDMVQIVNVMTTSLLYLKKAKRLFNINDTIMNFACIFNFVRGHITAEVRYCVIFNFISLPNRIQITLFTVEKLTWGKIWEGAYVIHLFPYSS